MGFSLEFSHFLSTYGARFVFALIALLIGWFIVKFLKKATKSFLVKFFHEETISSFLVSMLGSLYLFTLFAIVLTIAGVPSSYFAALLIGVGTTIGFSLRDEFKTVSNGIVILLTKPFKVGDAIDVNGFAGVVKEIRIFQTQLRTFDGLDVILSNGVLLRNGIKKFSGEGPRRHDLVYGVSYDDDTAKVKEILETIVNNNDKVLKDPSPMVALSEFGESSINFIVRAWCERADFLQVKFQINESVKTEFDKAGVTIPYPQRDVHMYSEKS